MIKKQSIFTCIQKLNIKAKAAEKKEKAGEDDLNLYFSCMQYLKQLKDILNTNEEIRAINNKK